MLWFGQGQDESWLTQQGWRPSVGAEGWTALRQQVSTVARTETDAEHGTSTTSPGAALVSTTIPMTLRHFYGELIAIMRSDGYDVTLVSSSGAHLNAAVSETGARAHVIEMSRDVTPARDLRAWMQWFRVVRARRPAVVVAGTPKAALLAMTASAMYGVPRRVYLCGGLRLEGSTGLLRHVLVWMERLAMGAATEVMVNSSTLKAEVLSSHLVSPAKLRQTVPGSTHGVNARHFAPREPDAQLRDQYGIAADTAVLGFVGRLTHDKGIDTLIDAASLLMRAGTRLHLLIVGPQNEPDSQDYLSRLESSGVPVSLVGPVEDVRPYYALLSLLVLPSLREGFPNVVLEAAAMGVPTVTTTATGCRDSVIDGRTGLLVDPGDAQALSAAIARGIADPARLAEMGRNARSWVEAEFRPERIVSTWFHSPLNGDCRGKANVTR
ncbi:hypothetical protein GCM10009721_26440 [Terrabacter tumescens]|uniref:Glycosyltransferase subfamily 4-like N-terminal domain-containing protein n=2 Tax=Terrabacter tumescens TaxID=60443 RepID=A0ABQ2I1Z8_9MICO|nr:hypothetical protein GCM10009721_26440 [Terrabacter tumescens]